MGILFAFWLVEFDDLSLNGEDSDCVANVNTSEIPLYNAFLNTFPNPSNGGLFIESNYPIELLEIKDASGRIVLKMLPQESNVYIQTSQLKSSFYFLSCLIKQEWVSRKIIINQK